MKNSIMQTWHLLTKYLWNIEQRAPTLFKNTAAISMFKKGCNRFVRNIPLMKLLFSHLQLCEKFSFILDIFHYRLKESEQDAILICFK